MIRTIARVLSLFVLGWAAQGVLAADIPRPEHPTPDQVRAHWSNLNGPWDFRFDPQDQGTGAGWFKPDAQGFDRKIEVPFGWESELSGVHKEKGAPKVGWYRRTFRVPDDFPKGERIWLSFGAVDYRADVWVNGKPVASHEGGYTPFSADVTEAIRPNEPATLVVRAFDPTDPNLPTGKQIGWYTPTSGIWQTVWLEARPEARIARFTVKTTVEPAEAVFEVELAGTGQGKHTVSVRSDDPTVGPASAEVVGATGATLRVPVKQAKLWTPETPHLYEVTLDLKGPNGEADSVKTYFGLRTIARGRYGDAPYERLLLNGKPLYLRAALDQSFNPKGIYTAPDDEFLRNDIKLAKEAGLNALRIHIKPDEPRRLYWADKLGLLIMEDMPNTWEQSPVARKAWEASMREAIVRDRNHPSIFAWVAFNETWGLGTPDRYKADRDTQEWVGAMVGEIRKLDPTRLVEDNSPCNYDHVENTDLNSWHFYIDDSAESRKHIDDVVKQTEPGSGFNYCPGRKQSTAPLINSEYGSVSAGSGDRDVSWGFRDLTTQLRRQPKVQGYVYTELSDIEWEHNGFYNYDRSPKEFGYGAFVKGMTPADLQGADFIGYDAPPAIVVKSGEEISIPLFVSHFSDLKDDPTLKWWVSGVDDDGKGDATEPQERRVDWSPYGVKALKPIKLRIKGGFVGAAALVLEDAGHRKIAANFVNIIVKSEKPRPRVERVNDHEVAVRFAPGDFARSKWSGKSASPAGKAYGRGFGAFTYRLKLPEAVVKAKLEVVEILLEVAAKSDRERVDWPSRVNGQDYPQTDARKWPSTLEVTINGQRVARVDLDDDPADARGVLSHVARFEHGSHGELIRLKTPLPGTAKADLAAGRPLILRLAVPEDARHPGGLSVFGAETGAFPFDPTLSFLVEDDLPKDLGVNPDALAAIDTTHSKQTTLMPAGDDGPDKAPTWAYTTADPAASWAEADFDDREWKRGKAGFGTPMTPAVKLNTRWDTPNIWLRTSATLPELMEDDSLSLHLFHNDDVEVFVNGKPLYKAGGNISTYSDIVLDDLQKSLFRPGKNLIAVYCRQLGGNQGIDLGLKLNRRE